MIYFIFFKIYIDTETINTKHHSKTTTVYWASFLTQPADATN